MADVEAEKVAARATQPEERVADNQRRPALPDDL
jgi:hypothetical protein